MFSVTVPPVLSDSRSTSFVPFPPTRIRPRQFRLPEKYGFHTESLHLTSAHLRSAIGDQRSRARGDSGLETLGAGRATTACAESRASRCGRRSEVSDQASDRARIRASRLPVRRQAQVASKRSRRFGTFHELP